MDNNNYNQINDDLVYVIDEPTSNMQKKRRLSSLSWWLFALAIASIPIALLVMTLWTGAISPKTFTAGWISAVSIPLPVASLIFGLYMKKRGYQYYRNIVIGIIMTFFAVSYTILFTPLFSPLHALQYPSSTVRQHRYTTAHHTPRNADTCHQTTRA